jgi:hypothetical protein
MSDVVTLYAVYGRESALRTILRHISTGPRATTAKKTQECDRFHVRRGATTPLVTLPHFPEELTNIGGLVVGGVPIVCLQIHGIYDLFLVLFKNNA